MITERASKPPPQHLRTYVLDEVAAKLVEGKPLSRRQYKKISRQASEGLTESLTPKYILRLAASKRS